MKTSLIITTYNWPEALDAVLSSVLKQTRLPNEIIIADDGSGNDTYEVIKKYQSLFPCPLVHSWQEDNGFQLSKSRNKAISRSTSDYIIMIDGDMVLDKNFIHDHERFSKCGYFLQGGRVVTGMKSSINLLKKRKLSPFFSSDIKHKLRCIRSQLLSSIFTKEKNNYKSSKFCNVSFWRSDVIDINGFNEDFIGWGYEDTEFCCRMLNAGKKRIYLKFTAIAYHIYHDESSKKDTSKNRVLFQKTRDEKLFKCENGIDKYLK